MRFVHNMTKILTYIDINIDVTKLFKILMKYCFICVNVNICKKTTAC